MATGLATFDAFSWASLLKGRRVLVVDRNGARGRATLEALEEAGAIATLSPNQAFAADRLAEGPFRHIVLSLSDAEALSTAASNAPTLSSSSCNSTAVRGESATSSVAVRPSLRGTVV